MDITSKKTAENDQQSLEMSQEERILELEKKISNLQKENQELIQKLLIENATSEVIKKVNSYFAEIISVGRAIALPLLVITGLVGVGGIWGIYSAAQKEAKEKAKETIENYLTDSKNKKMDELIAEIAPQVINNIVENPKQLEKIIEEISQTLTSKPEFINKLTQSENFYQNLIPRIMPQILANPQFQAALQTSKIMPTNTSTSPETKYYVVTGSSFIKKEVESDQKIARKFKLNSKVCISNSRPPAYVMVVALKNNQDFQLDLNTAKKTLEKANTVDLFKRNGAYFIAINDDLFFSCNKF